MPRQKGFEQSELTKARIKVASLRGAAEVAQLKYEDAKRVLEEMEAELAPTVFEVNLTEYEKVDDGKLTVEEHAASVVGAARRRLVADVLKAYGAENIELTDEERARLVKVYEHATSLGAQTVGVPDEARRIILTAWNREDADGAE